MINIERTKQYYHLLRQDKLCNCNYCRNYYSQIKTEYPEVARYVSSFGIDIEKPYELCPLDPDENDILEYCYCMYIVFGEQPDTYDHHIGDVTFEIASSYPSTDIVEPHFVIGFYPIKLKMLLPR